MNRLSLFLLLVVATAPNAIPGPSSSTVVSVCDLSRNYSAHRNKVVTVRGVYGLRQEDCPQKCTEGPWPSFVDLEGGDGTSGDELANALRRVEIEAKSGKRFEIWVTVTDKLQTTMRQSAAGPCDKKGWYPGYGHLGAFPAQIIVSRFSNIEVRENPRSPYDYRNMYHGAP
jgi:hypothetical protein